MELPRGSSACWWRPDAATARRQDVVELPSGNLLALSSEVRSYDNFPTSAGDPNAPTTTRDLAGDVIVEFQRDGVIVR